MNLAIIFPLALGAIVVFWLLSRGEQRKVVWRAKDAPDEDPRDVSLKSIIEASRDPELMRSIESGNTISAIKRMRELTGMGLKDSKDVVEKIIRLRQ
jgi:Na+/H+ antiporter NhaC